MYGTDFRGHRDRQKLIMQNKKRMALTHGNALFLDVLLEY